MATPDRLHVYILEIIYHMISAKLHLLFILINVLVFNIQFAQCTLQRYPPKIKMATKTATPRGCNS